MIKIKKIRKKPDGTTLYNCMNCCEKQADYDMFIGTLHLTVCNDCIKQVKDNILDVIEE